MSTEASRALDRSMVRAVAWTAGAKWATQVFGWVATFVVARFLHPYDYGLVGMAGIYVNLTTLVSQVGVADAVITLRDLNRRQTAELNTVALLIGGALVGLSCAVASPIAHFFSAPPLRAVLIVGSSTYIINALPVVPRALLQKELRFKLIAGIETVRAFSQMIATLILAWLGFGYWSLVDGAIVGCVVAALVTLSYRRHGFASPNFTNIYRELRFSGHVLLSNVAWYVYSNADFLVAGKMLGEAPLGNYTVAWTISSAPIEKVGNLITGVTPAFFSVVQNNNFELRRYFLRLTEALAYVTVPASIGIVLLADYLVPVLLGPKWAGVVGPLRWLGILVAFRSLTTMLPRLLTAVSDTKFVLWTAALAAIVLPLGFLVGSRWGNNGIAIAWVVCYPPLMVPLYYRIFRRIETSAREYVRTVLPAVIAASIMTVAVILLRATLPARWPMTARFMLLVVTGATCYAAALLTFYRQRMTQLWGSIWRTRDEHMRPEMVASHAAVAGEWAK